MEIDIIFKIAAVGIIVTIICQILKKSDRDDIATIVSLAGLIIVLTVVLDKDFEHIFLPEEELLRNIDAEPVIRIDVLKKVLPVEIDMALPRNTAEAEQKFVPSFPFERKFFAV